MGQRELGGRERERERGCPRGFESHPQALLDALPPTWQFKPPKSQLHAGMGLRRHCEPNGSVPCESCVALISKLALLPSLKRIVCVPPAKESGCAWKHSSVRPAGLDLGQSR